MTTCTRVSELFLSAVGRLINNRVVGHASISRQCYMDDLQVTAAGSCWNGYNGDNNWLTRLCLTMPANYARRTFNISLINGNIIRRINRRDVTPRDHESREQRTAHLCASSLVSKSRDPRGIPEMTSTILWNLFGTSWGCFFFFVAPELWTV